MDYSSLPRFPGDPDRTPDPHREVPDRGSPSEVGLVLLAAVATVAVGTYLSVRLMLRYAVIGVPL